MLAHFKIDDLAARVLAVTDDACRRLAAIGATIYSQRAPGASGIVAFELAGRDPLAMKKDLLKRHVVLGCRAGRLRISPHAYTNDEDLDRLIEAIRAVR